LKPFWPYVLTCRWHCRTAKSSAKSAFWWISFNTHYEKKLQGLCGNDYISASLYPVFQPSCWLGQSPTHISQIHSKSGQAGLNHVGNKNATVHLSRERKRPKNLRPAAGMMLAWRPAFDYILQSHLAVDLDSELQRCLHCRTFDWTTCYIKEVATCKGDSKILTLPPLSGIFSTSRISSAWRNKMQRPLKIKCFVLPRFFNSALLGAFSWFCQSRIWFSQIHSSSVWPACRK
jgi:hypothetical protein